MPRLLNDLAFLYRLGAFASVELQVGNATVGAYWDEEAVLSPDTFGGLLPQTTRVLKIATPEPGTDLATSLTKEASATVTDPERGITTSYTVRGVEPFADGRETRLFVVPT